MATSNGQYAPVFLPGESHSLTEKPGRPQSTGSPRIGHYQSDPVHIDARLFFFFFACGSFALMRVEHGLEGFWKHQVCRDTDCLRCSYGPLRVFFRASCSWQSEGLFGQSFSIAPPVQALKRAPFPGVLLCCSAHHAHRGGPLAGVLLCRSAH